MDEMMKAQQEYEDKFGDQFPTFVFRCDGEKEVTEMIKKCVANNKDVYGMGYLVREDDIEY